MTLAEFSDIFGVLAVQLRFSDADEGTIRGYYRAMQNSELELVALAAERFATKGGSDGHWFPKTSEWLSMTGRIQSERQDKLQGVIRARQHRGLPPLCNLCDDTGYERVQNGVTPCECRAMRRLEMIGRRPLPLLTEGEEATTNTAAEEVDELIEAMAERHQMPDAGVYLQTKPDGSDLD